VLRGPAPVVAISPFCGVIGWDWTANSTLVFDPQRPVLPRQAAIPPAPVEPPWSVPEPPRPSRPYLQRWGSPDKAPCFEVAMLPRRFQESGSRDLGLKYSTTPNPGSVSGSKSMMYMQLERLCWAPGYFIMETSQDYRQFAQECDRLSEEAMTEEQRRTLKKMAAAWRKVAQEYDREHLTRAR
jgi:hypothetical protein